MSFDVNCYDLACKILSDYPDKDNKHNRGILAQWIQDAIENFTAQIENSDTEYDKHLEQNLRDVEKLDAARKAPRLKPKQGG